MQLLLDASLYRGCMTPEQVRGDNATVTGCFPLQDQHDDMRRPG